MILQWLLEDMVFPILKCLCDKWMMNYTGAIRGILVPTLLGIYSSSSGYDRVKNCLNIYFTIT